MAIVNVNGISGINSITAQGTSLNFYTAAGSNLPISAATLNVGTGASVSSPATNVLTLGTNNSERVRVDSSGNIGLGTNTVLSTYRIELDSASSSSSANLITLTARNTSSQAKRFYVQASGLDSTPLYTFATGAVGTDPAIAFAPTGTEALRITTTGSIGIGTNNPSSKLQVQGTIGLGASDDLESVFSGGRTKLTSSPSGFVINHNDNSATIFQNQGVERARISTSGNLGIGTNNPLGVLAVSGGISNPTITFQNGSATNTASDAAVGSIVGYSRTTGGNINIGSVDIRTDTSSASSGVVRILTASNGVLAETFRVDSSGRVTTPYQPMAYVTYTGAAIVRANIIPFTAVTNQGNHWNNSSYIFTCPVAGIYHASLNITGNTTQSVQVQTYIRKNGNNMAISYYPGGPVSISILCAANDTIDFVYNHDNAGYPGATPAYASVHLVG